jgi:hypothetical protein
MSHKELKDDLSKIYGAVVDESRVKLKTIGAFCPRTSTVLYFVTPSFRYYGFVLNKT